MKKVLAERSQKTQSFQWPVSAVWSTFSALVEIIDATTMRAPQDWRRSVRGIPRAVEQPRSRVRGDAVDGRRGGCAAVATMPIFMSSARE